MGFGVSRSPLLLGASIAVAVEAASNAAFAWKLGGRLSVPIAGVQVPLDSSFLGAIAVGVALFQANSATRIVHGPDRGIAAAFFVPCLAVSASCMFLHVTELQRWHANREPNAKPYERLEKEYRRLEGELSGLGTPRPGDVITAEIRSYPIPERVWKDTDQCTKKLQDETNARTCAPVNKLYVERANRSRIAELEPKLVELRATLDAMAKPDTVEKSPAEAWAIAFFPWLFAGVVELLATFGFAYARRASRSSDTPPTPRKPPQGMNGHGPTVTPPKSAGSRAKDIRSILDDVSAGRIQVPGSKVYPDGSVYAPQSALGTVAGTSKATVNRELKAAVSAGTLKIIAHGTVNAYKIN